MTNSNVKFHTFKKSDALVEALAQVIAGNLQEAITQRGHASLIVSGGSTPKPLFEKLQNIRLGWEKVTVGLCDERWVSPDHKDSNETFVKTFLLQGEAAKATFSGMYIKGVNAEDAQALCSAKVEAQLLPIDVLILGMGHDAHTASLFPGNSKLDKGLDLDNPSQCISIDPQSAPHSRMSLTRKAILGARQLYLHFEGKEKLAVYEEAMKGEGMTTMPIRSILKQPVKAVEVYFA